MTQPSNEIIHNELKSFRKELLDKETGFITGKTGIIAHLATLNGQVYKNTKWRWQTKTGLTILVFLVGTIAGYFKFFI